MAEVTEFGTIYLFAFFWITAGLLGAALAPTDPAVMLSVLGKREVGGRSSTILEPDDEVLALVPPEDEHELARLLRGPA